MKAVVITGSTRGIGFGLAKALLQRGCKVVISGRGEESVHSAKEALERFGSQTNVLGQVCDVRSEKALMALWEAATEKLGRVDIWVNNAGIANQPDQAWKIDPDEIKAVVNTNILGSVLGAQIAIRGMLEQGYGAIYFMEGAGSDGRSHRGTLIYGMTKYALDYFFKGVVDELNDTALIAGAIRPGMVVTDLITGPYEGRPDEWDKVKPIFNIIADPLDQVSEWMAEEILSNTENGKILNRLSRLAILFRFLKAPFIKRDLFADLD